MANAIQKAYQGMELKLNFSPALDLVNTVLD